MTNETRPNIDASGQFIRSAPAPARPYTSGYVNESGEFVRGTDAPQPKKAKKNSCEDKTSLTSDLKSKIRERLLKLDLS